MSRWLIQLHGEEMDLEELPKWFPKGEVYAIEKNGTYYLTGPAFDAANNADAILELGRDSLDEFSAIISLLWKSFQKPTIAHVAHEDESGAKSAYVFLSGIASGRSKMGGVLVDASGNTSAPETTQAQDLLSAAKRSSHLREALAVWGDPIRTWGRLYRVMEEIESHFQKPVDKAGLCSEAERTRFTRTANTAEAAGLDARHGSRRFDPPSKPISLEEGASFISSLLERSLRR